MSETALLAEAVAVSPVLRFLILKPCAYAANTSSGTLAVLTGKQISAEPKQIQAAHEDFAGAGSTKKEGESHRFGSPLKIKFCVVPNGAGKSNARLGGALPNAGIFLCRNENFL